MTDQPRSPGVLSSKEVPVSTQVSGHVDTSAPCFNGGEVYVGYGVDLVMVAFTRDVKWWRNSAWLRPADARSLANALLHQADSAEATEQPSEHARGSR